MKAILAILLSALLCLQSTSVYPMEKSITERNAAHFLTGETRMMTEREGNPLCCQACDKTVQWTVLSFEETDDLKEETVPSEGPQISAPSAILMEASTGTILFEKDADTARPPASVTKVMTMLLIFDALESGKIRLEDEVSTSEFAASMGGSQVFLEPGETQTVETMLKCISVASANDACVAFKNSRHFFMFETI